MFTLTRVIGVVSPGSLQPAQLQVVGDWVCPGGGNAGIALEMQITSPAGAPTTTFTATSNSGPGGPPGSVVFLIPAWPGLTCGAKFSCSVRGLCNGQWTTANSVDGEVDCLACPRVQLDPPMLGACSGTPATQSVTLSGTVMLPPGQSTQLFWDFGDGTTSNAGVLVNSTGNWNTPLPVSVTHAYAHRTTPYQACLKPPGNSECPQVCVALATTCMTTTCPVIGGTVSYGVCTAVGARPVTLDLSFAPPLPQNSVVQISWAYGGPTTTGATSATQVVPTGAGSVSTASHVAEFVHRAGGYDVTATVVVVIAGQVCPLQPSTVDIDVDPLPCLPCPDPGHPISVIVTVPSDPAWCAPMTTALFASFTAQVNWLPPAPAAPPLPVRYDWTVSTPAGGAGTATRSSTTPTVRTDSGWSGSGANAGALKLGAAGTYSVAVNAVFAPNAGLPTDASGAVSCNLAGSASFALSACQPRPRDCPSMTGLTASAGCVDSAAATPANVTVTASVDDPAGTAQGFDWDFGDPGTAGNQMSTATPAATHSYSTTGSFTVSCRVRSSDLTCPPSGRLTTTVGIATCPVVTPPSRPSCATLLWAALILLMVGALLLITGCLIGAYVAPPAGPIAGLVLSIIGIVLGAIGLILFIVWAIICARFTACSVILAAMDFIGAMIIVFGVIAVVLAIIAAITQVSWPCFFQSLVTTAFWGVLLYVMYRIALGVGCLVAGSGGPPPPKPPSSSSSGLTSGRGLTPFMSRNQTGNVDVVTRLQPRPARIEGLGDVVSRVVAVAGLQPCSACHERAAWLNAALPLKHR